MRRLKTLFQVLQSRRSPSGWGRVLGVLGLGIVLASLPGGAVFAAEGVATLKSVQGEVRVRPDAKSDWAKAREDAVLAEGARIRTGQPGSVTLSFADGTETKLQASTEISVRAPNKEQGTGNSVVLFFGRLWAKVAHRAAADGRFEVRSANAVAGVRGTQFEVGVADDGSTRVVVSDGRVGVGGDDEEREVEVGQGYEVESSGEGRIGQRSKSSDDPDWPGWFAARAKKLEQRGVEVAKNLNGRLDRRRAKVEKLLKEQRELRKDIERLEKEKKRGRPVDGALRAKLRTLEQVTARIEDMKTRLDAAFGMFSRWGTLAEKGGFPGSEKLRAMAVDVDKVARDFADMIEEGTDMSEEGMEDMMEDMGKGKRDRPTKSAGDELFR